MAADLPENYENQPAFEFIKAVPVDWDDTKVLNAEIGDYVTIARKRGDNWFIGSITDENSRVLLLALDFLDAGRKYSARVYADTPYTDWEMNPGLIDISECFVDQNTTMTVKLARGGGQAIRILPAVDHELPE
jgi:alpha-glucosidase